MLQSVKIGGNPTGNARFDAPTCLVSGLWLSCGLAVSMGHKQVVMSFCVASAALCDIPTCLITCRQLFLCGMRQTQYFCIVFTR